MGSRKITGLPTKITSQKSASVPCNGATEQTFCCAQDGERSRAVNPVMHHPLVVLFHVWFRASAPAPLLLLFPGALRLMAGALARARALLYARFAWHARKRINPNREYIT
jgi:hypothetical protein